jgi:DNA-binding LytR/AlgR family response regulator
MKETDIKKKVFIVEDNADLSDNVRQILTLKGYEIVYTLPEAESAIGIIEENIPDVILLDIMLKGKKNGISLAEDLRKNIDLPIVFLTASSGPEIIKKIKHIKPEGFVTKPFTPEGLVTAIELAMETFSLNREQANKTPPESKKKDSDLFIRENGWLKRIRIDKIDWIRAEGTYIHIFVSKKQYTLRATVKDLMEKLPSSNFCRIHKSYIVNLKRIDAVNATEVKIDGSGIPIGRNYYPALLKLINKLST